MPLLVKSGKTPPSGAIFWSKRVNEPFENFFGRTPPFLGALNPNNILMESQKFLLEYVWGKVVCRYLVPRLVKSDKPPPPGGPF